MTCVTINVATEDNDTTNIGAELEGAVLKLSLGKNTAQVDLSSLIPQGQADRFLSAVSYDEDAKELVFTTSKAGEEDKTFHVPLADVFKTGVEIEEVLSKENDNLDASFVVRGYLPGGSELGITPEAVGRIKGTDWYVFKFNSDDINEWITKRNEPRPQFRDFNPTSDDPDNGAYVFEWKSLMRTSQDDPTQCGEDISVVRTDITFRTEYGVDYAKAFKQETLPQQLILRMEMPSGQNGEWTFNAVTEDGKITRYEAPTTLPESRLGVANQTVKFYLDAVIDGTRIAMPDRWDIATPMCEERTPSGA